MTFDDRMGRQVTGVAGAYAPAFVERCWYAVPGSAETAICVAGAYAPAFVERTVKHLPADPPAWWCRRSLCSGLR